MKQTFISTARLTVGRFTVRVWRSELHLLAASQPERKDLDIVEKDLNEILKREGVHVSRIAHEFSHMPRVVRVEVLDNAGNGMRIENK